MTLHPPFRSAVSAYLIYIPLSATSREFSSITDYKTAGDFVQARQGSLKPVIARSCALS